MDLSIEFVPKLISTLSISEMIFLLHSVEDTTEDSVMIVEDTTEDMVDVKISIMKICPYTLQDSGINFRWYKILGT